MGQWKEGIQAPWPPRPELRFDVGARVECRIGPHPVKGWAPGRVVRLYYSEPDWPPNMYVSLSPNLHVSRSFIIVNFSFNLFLTFKGWLRIRSFYTMVDLFLRLKTAIR